MLLAAPRAFCAGVEMAIKALAWMVRAFEPPVYCYHEIVHNQLVVKRFEESGVIFVDDIADVPAGRPIMLSAHGSAPSRRSSPPRVAMSSARLSSRHQGPPRVKTRAEKGYQIVYIGHEGHEEAVGTMAVAPDHIHRVNLATRLLRSPNSSSPSPSSPKPRCRTASGPTSSRRPKSVSLICGSQVAPTCASPPPTDRLR